MATFDLFKRFFGATFGEQERREKPRINAREGTRILIVDDSPTIVALLRKFLQQSGYITLEAGDAEKGVELARAERPDMIFLDIVLPGMPRSLRCPPSGPDTVDCCRRETAHGERGLAIQFWLSCRARR